MGQWVTDPYTGTRVYQWSPDEAQAMAAPFGSQVLTGAVGTDSMNIDGLAQNVESMRSNRRALLAGQTLGYTDPRMYMPLADKTTGPPTGGFPPAAPPPLYTESATPHTKQPAQPQSIGGVPDKTQQQEVALTPEAMDAKLARKKIMGQLLTSGGIGALQAGLPFVPLFRTDAEKEAKEMKKKWGGDAPDKYGEKIRGESLDRGREALNRRAELGRGVQEDIAASMGGMDAGAQQAIRKSMMQAFTSGEAELEANASKLGMQAADQKRGLYQSSIAYLSQIKTARMQAVSDAVSKFAPVLAQIHVNSGVMAMGDTIKKLPPEYQEMFYSLSSGAKDPTELSKLLAFVYERKEAADALAAKVAADKATLAQQG